MVRVRLVSRLFHVAYNYVRDRASNYRFAYDAFTSATVGRTYRVFQGGNVGCYLSIQFVRSRVLHLCLATTFLSSVDREGRKGCLQLLKGRKVGSDVAWFGVTGNSFTGFYARRVYRLGAVHCEGASYLYGLFYRDFCPSLARVFRYFLSGQRGRMILALDEHLRAFRGVNIVAAYGSSIAYSRCVTNFVVRKLFHVGK